jgi:hypothetical protein
LILFIKNIEIFLLEFHLFRLSLLVLLNLNYNCNFNNFPKDNGSDETKRWLDFGHSTTNIKRRGFGKNERESLMKFDRIYDENFSLQNSENARLQEIPPGSDLSNLFHNAT